MYQAQQVQRLAGPVISLLGPPRLRGAGGGGAGGAIWGLLSVASIAASAYHGAKRNGGSIGWGVGWGLLGGLFPVLTPAIGAAQGFAVCKNHCGGVRGSRRYRRGR